MLLRDARRFRLRITLQPHQVWPEERRKPLLPPDMKVLRGCYGAYMKARDVYAALIDTAIKSKRARMELTIRSRWLVSTLAQRAQELFNVSLHAELVRRRGRYPPPPEDIVQALRDRNQRML